MGANDGYMVYTQIIACACQLLAWSSKSDSCSHACKTDAFALHHRAENTVPMNGELYG